MLEFVRFEQNRREGFAVRSSIPGSTSFPCNNSNMISSVLARRIALTVEAVLSGRSRTGRRSTTRTRRRPRTRRRTRAPARPSTAPARITSASDRSNKITTTTTTTGRCTNCGVSGGEEMLRRTSAPTCPETSAHEVEAEEKIASPRRGARTDRFGAEIRYRQRKGRKRTRIRKRRRKKRTAECGAARDSPSSPPNRERRTKTTEQQQRASRATAAMTKTTATGVRYFAGGN